MAGRDPPAGQSAQLAAVGSSSPAGRSALLAVAGSAQLKYADAEACFLALFCLVMALRRCFLLRRGFCCRGGGVVTFVMSSDPHMVKHPRQAVLGCCRGVELVCISTLEHMLYHSRWVGDAEVTSVTTAHPLSVPRQTHMVVPTEWGGG